MEEQKESQRMEMADLRKTFTEIIEMLDTEDYLRFVRRSLMQEEKKVLNNNASK